MSGSRFFRDTSTTVLIFANVVTIIVAVAFKWNVIDVMWVYWAQSVIIGLIACFRMLLLKQIFTAGFFLIHYGGFHAGYFLFLYFPEQPQTDIPVVGIALCILIFLVNHAFSYWHNRKRDMNRKPNIGTLMFAPYVRIIPMHITIVFGSNYAESTGTLALFLVLKTIMDVIMHMVEHRNRRPEGETGSL